MLYISMRQCTIFILFLASGQVTGLSTQSLLYGHSLRKSIFSRDESTDSGDDSSGSLDEVPVASSSGMGAATRNQIIIAIVVAVISLIGISAAAVTFIRKKRRWDAIESNHQGRALEYYVPPAYRYREHPLLPRASPYDVEASFTPPPAYPGLPPYDPSTYRNRNRDPIPMGTYNNRAGSGPEHRSNHSLSSHLSFTYQPVIPLSREHSSHIRPMHPPQSHARAPTAHSADLPRRTSSLNVNRVEGLSDAVPMTSIQGPRKPKPVLPKLITNL